MNEEEPWQRSRRKFQEGLDRDMREHESNMNRRRYEMESENRNFNSWMMGMILFIMIAGGGLASCAG